MKFQWRKIICCGRPPEFSYNLLKSSEQRVVFKFQVFDEIIKQKAGEVVGKFFGITSLDLNEKYMLKVTGRFDKFKMMKKLKKIDQRVDIIEVTKIGVKKKEVNKPPEPQVTPQKAPTIDNKKVNNKPSEPSNWNGALNVLGALKDLGGRAVEQINRENANKLIAYGRGFVGYFRKEEAKKRKGGATILREFNENANKRNPKKENHERATI